MVFYPNITKKHHQGYKETFYLVPQFGGLNNDKK